jgi:hypothetical protein
VAITSKGKRWEILHSWWIVLTFTLGFFNWVAFLYIGFRAKQRKWILWGLFYSISFVMMILFDSQGRLPTWLQNLMFFLIVGLGIISILRAFLVRRGYLVRLEAVQREASEKESALKQHLDPKIDQREAVPTQSTDTSEEVDQVAPHWDLEESAALSGHSARPFQLGSIMRCSRGTHAELFIRDRKY